VLSMFEANISGERHKIFPTVSLSKPISLKKKTI